ncbi:Cof-type HAD-IIB family hydrolase [Staphylococcus sp. SQ8-PEA]|uniref:Cof-type HAD-IIB family hydrolase n=1 Tax=Staphylococcus marylandisciuri TaxID=2981529 RepID=A0ABT2QRK0_9STAP|nr:HAD family hydrolase [Staphylococcus marylandisciuri]MCU5746613.1 Cof-type HAD-IIB family hydrolase [Staphylococcus marylandisciuri]
MDNVKAIFLDMDGTILHSNNRTSDYTVKTIDKLRQTGYKVFLATGRSHDEIKYLVPSDFSVDGIISSNGALGKVNQTVVFKHALNLEKVHQIVTRAQENNIYYEVFPFEGDRMILTTDKAWITTMIDGDEPRGGVSTSEWTSRKDALKDKVRWVSQLPDIEFAKIYLFASHQSRIESFRADLINEQKTLGISVSNSSRFNAETMAYGKNKGTAIAEMIDYFNIKQEETLVIGDSDNDRSMFEFAHYTIAMKNARPEVQALTRDITSKTNEEDGAAHYLEDNLLNI